MRNDERDPSWEFPFRLVVQVFRLWQQDIQRLAGGVDFRNQPFELGLAHGGAASGGATSASPPDVEEDRRSCMGRYVGLGIVGDEQF